MKRMQGFSLVELMIGITLGLLLIAAATSVFLGSRSSYGSTTGISALTDSARFATQFLSQAARSTGFVGCIADNKGQTSYLQVDSSVAVGPPYPPAVDFIELLSGYEAVGTSPGNTVTINSAAVNWDSNAADWTPALPTSAFQPVIYSNPTGTPVPGPGLSSVKYSDILVTHNTVPPSIGPDLPVYVMTGIGQAQTTFTVSSNQINNGNNGQPVLTLATGDVLVVTDCSTDGYIFAASGVGGNTITVPNAAVFANYEFPAGAEVSLPSTSVFFIGVGEDGDTALWRADYNVNTFGGPIQLSATELVPDVENMQILYGADIVGAYSVTNYYTADQAANLANYANNGNYKQDPTQFYGFNTVENIRVGLLIASPPNAMPVPAAAQTYSVLGTNVTVAPDSRMRQVYEFTITVRDALD